MSAPASYLDLKESSTEKPEWLKYQTTEPWSSDVLVCTYLLVAPLLYTIID
jgi:hypothetical protein